MSESEAVTIIKKVDTSLAPSSVQPMVEDVTVLFRTVNRISEEDMAAYEESVINQFMDDSDKDLCQEKISEIKERVETFTGDIIAQLIALINELKGPKDRVLQLEGGKRRKKKGGLTPDQNAENIIGAIPVFILFFIIFQVFGAIVSAINSIGKSVSKFLPETEQIQGPPGRRIDRTAAIGPTGRYGGKKSRRQRRRRTVKRR
jgi:hypothetical protein